MKSKPGAIARIKKFVSFMGRHNLSELVFQGKEIKLKLKKYIPKETSQVGEKPLATIVTPVAETELVKSPIAGVFYTSPSARAAPFVEPGDIVEKEDTLCIVEAMKVMNEIKAEKRCKIEKVLVKNEEFVKLDQALFAIIPV